MVGQEVLSRVSSVSSPQLMRRMLVALLSGLALVALLGGPGHAASAKRSLPAVGRPAPEAAVAPPSGAELVGKLLSERATASDPDVPLPQRDLTPQERSFEPLMGPQLYGRRDEGSVVLGLKIPIPADRGAFQ